MDNLISLFYKTEDYFFNSIAKNFLTFNDVTIARTTGINFKFFNSLELRKEIKNFDEVLGEAREFFKDLPWVVVAQENISMPSNLKLIEQTVSMFIELEGHQLDVSADIECTDEKLDDWIFPLVAAFESTDEISEQYKQRHIKALKIGAKFYHFTIYNNSFPVSSITLSFDGENARIDDVGTLPGHRSRGYATALVHYVLNKALTLGAKYCFLEASNKGFSVYQRIGFKTLFSNKIYEES